MLHSRILRVLLFFHGSMFSLVGPWFGIKRVGPNDVRIRGLKVGRPTNQVRTQMSDERPPDEHRGRQVVARLIVGDRRSPVSHCGRPVVARLSLWASGGRPDLVVGKRWSPGSRYGRAMVARFSLWASSGRPALVAGEQWSPDCCGRQTDTRIFFNTLVSIIINFRRQTSKNR